MKLLIALPVWGKRCVDLFSGVVLDSHADALKNFKGTVRYVCHTDNADIPKIIKQKTGCATLTPRLPEVTETYARYGWCNKDALRFAKEDEVIIFLNADIIISREFFAVIQKRIEQGFKCICMGSVRTFPKEMPKRDIASRELLQWSVDNLHPIYRSLIWGSGNSRYLSSVIFKDKEAWSIRVFHAHPVAAVYSEDMRFTDTVDRDLAAGFDRSEIYMVTDADECSFAEISPQDKHLQTGDTPFNVSHICDWAKRGAAEINWWFFGHRVELTGIPDIDDESIVMECIASKGLIAERPPKVRPYRIRGDEAHLC